MTSTVALRKHPRPSSRLPSPAVATDGTDLARELQLVERARGGDHNAFVHLYRQDAPPAWRLALALTADADRAADTVARAFARALGPPRPGELRSGDPFRTQLLRATHHVVVDRAAASLPSAAPPIPEPGADTGPGGNDTRAALPVEVMSAYHQLPERWRSVLWLVVVEGLGTAEAGRVLGLPEPDTEELVARAVAGLRSQWTRDRMATGRPAPPAPDHLERHLQTVLPLPLDLFAIAEGRWQAGRVPAAAAPLLLVLPGGRHLPRWAERSLLASTAALIALGITSALALDRDPDVRRARGDRSIAAGPADPLRSDDGSARDGGRGLHDAAGRALADGDVAELFRLPGGVDADTVRATSAGTALRATSSASTTTSSSSTSIPAPGESPRPTTPTTTEPQLEITAGIGPMLALSVGDRCTGIELAGEVLGCTPDPNTGVTVEGSLLP